MDEFVKDKDGDRSYSTDKFRELLAEYVKPCSDGLVLTGSALTPALNHKGLTVVEAPNAFVLNCHLMTALAVRMDTTKAWDMVTPDMAMNRFLDGEAQSQEDMLEGWDPLVFQASVWPDYLKASLKIGHICRTRTLLGKTTLFVVRDLEDLPTSPLWFDTDFSKWLGECPIVKLTLGSILPLVRNKAKAEEYMRTHPGYNKSTRPTAPRHEPSAPRSRDDQASKPAYTPAPRDGAPSGFPTRKSKFKG